MPETLEQEKMPIVQHLIELRSALLRSVIAIVILFAILFPFADDIYTFIAAHCASNTRLQPYRYWRYLSLLDATQDVIDSCHLYSYALFALPVMVIHSARTLSTWKKISNATCNIINDTFLYWAAFLFLYRFSRHFYFLVECGTSISRLCTRYPVLSGLYS